MKDSQNHSEISLGDRIKQLRQTKGLTQKAFAESLGIVQGYLSGIEQGKKMPSRTLLMALSYTYGVTEQWLFGGAERAGADISRPEPMTTGKGSVSIPLLKSVPEGFPEQVGPEDIVGHISLPGVSADCYALVVEGNFMAPTIMDGDLLIFRHAEPVTHRSIALITNKWGEVIIRRYRIKEGEAYFSSENPAYTPFKADRDTRIFGTVVSVWRKMRL